MIIALVIAVLVIAVLVIAVLIWTLRDRTKEIDALRERLIDINDRLIDINEQSNHYQNKWYLATEACRRFSLEVHELRGNESEEDKALVRIYNKGLESKYRINHIYQMPPFDRERARTMMDDIRRAASIIDAAPVDGYFGAKVSVLGKGHLG